MGPKKGRKNVWRIEVPTDTHTESELGYASADIQRRMKERELRERAEAVKWTQRVEERQAHLLNSNPGTRKDI